MRTLKPAVLDDEVLADAQRELNTTGVSDTVRAALQQAAARSARARQDEHWQAALKAQRELARQGRHRAVGMPDLLTVVLAAAHGLTVVHYDADFETAATVVPFEQVWVMPRGSL
jgi:predicted nucleic acid-binding protein